MLAESLKTNDSLSQRRQYELSLWVSSVPSAPQYYYWGGGNSGIWVGVDSGKSRTRGANVPHPHGVLAHDVYERHHPLVRYKPEEKKKV